MLSSKLLDLLSGVAAEVQKMLRVLLNQYGRLINLLSLSLEMQVQSRRKVSSGCLLEG